jgi:diacylglycerol kinase (CTP)
MDLVEALVLVPGGKRMKRDGDARIGQLISGGVATFPVRLHLRSDLHLLRKVWHMGMGLAIAFIYLYSNISTTLAVILLACAFGLDLLIETARLRIPSVNEKVLRFWGPFMRTSEMNRFSGIPHYLAACLLAVAIFPRPIAFLSILYLACGDPVASLVGILYGRKSIPIAPGKSLIGTLAGIVVCGLVSFVFLKTLGLPDSVVMIMSLVGGVAGGTAELMPFELDDNFTIPVISGFMLWLGFILFGI